METIRISTTAKYQAIDITDQVVKLLPSGSGTVTVFAQHSTAAITTANSGPGTENDLIDVLTSLAPDREWQRPHDPAHAPAHLLASILGASVTVPYTFGQLLLGSWQRIKFVEFDGPRERSILVAFAPLEQT
jgi:secondary thiamine-phosphate synthase enzyme